MYSRAIFVKYDGKFASRWRAKSPDALCAVLPTVSFLLFRLVITEFRQKTLTPHPQCVIIKKEIHMDMACNIAAVSMNHKEQKHETDYFDRRSSHRTAACRTLRRFPERTGKTDKTPENSNEIYIMIADAQALTDNAEHPEKVRQNITQVALDYLACGLDPEKAPFSFSPWYRS